MKMSTINKHIYSDMCAAVYCFGLENGLKIKIKNINKSKELKWWSKNTAKKLYESAL